MDKHITRAAGRKAGSAVVGRAAMIRHYADEISRRRDLTPQQKRKAVRSYRLSLTQ